MTPSPVLPAGSPADLAAILGGLVESAMDAILVCDGGQRLVLFNRAAESLFGIAARDALGSPLAAFLPERARRNHEESMREFARTGHTERRMGALHRVAGLHADGTELPLEAAISTVEVEGHRFFMAILRDLREVIEAERARHDALDRLRESEGRLRAFLENSQALVWIKDLHGRYREVSPYSRIAVGRSPEQMIGKTFAEVFSPEAAEPLAAHDRQVIATGEPIQALESVPVGGETRTFLSVKFPMRDAGGRVLGVGAICTDVTDWKRAEAALEAERVRLRTLIDTLPALVWLKDPEGAYLACNRRFAEMVGVPESELLGRTADDLLPAASAAAVRDHDRAAIAQGGPIVREEQFSFFDGRVVLHESTKTPMFGADGRLIGVLGIARDISAQREAEAAMRRVVSGSPAVIYALRDGPLGIELDWVSANIAALTGWTDTEARGGDWWLRHVHPEDRERALASAQIDSVTDHTVAEYRFRRKDGGYLWVRDEKRLLHAGNGQPAEIVGSWSDATERRRLEEQLRVAHKLEAIGRLAGGVAHDFNNLLTVIAGNTEMLGELAPADRALVAEVRDACERAASLTRQLLAFSRSQVLEPKVIDLAGAVRRIESMLRRLIGEDIELVCDLAEDTGRVRVDPGQLEQVIVNLAINARDAMPDGGRLALSTAAVTVAPGDPRRRPGRYARLTVADSGTGMTPEVRARVFEPFFTTKPPGRGTGLGLATVFGIVEQSAGHIELESEPGRGTRFDIDLPSVAEEAARPESAATAPLPSTGSETILLVEDEPSVRRLARLALEGRGYKVLGAEDGLTALSLAERHRGPIDLLITDLVMPGMSGRELADLLHGHRPGLRVIFMSGYVEHAELRTALVRGGGAFLQKPFSMVDLAAKVREVLEERPGAAPGPREDLGELP
jgi:PAS domain S-box-containing protein